MWRWEQPPAGSASPGCPDLLRHVDGPRSPLSPLYLSFFEEECRTIATRLRLGAAVAAEPLPDPGEGSALWADAAGPVTSTPLHTSPPLDEGAPDSATPAARPEHGWLRGRRRPGPGPPAACCRRWPRRSAARLQPRPPAGLVP
ncbi:translation initiation factor IF-2-like [Aquila chrysaetos chrysaetos]|uniref:translation initiation factor IF-2-like n=1 Tax=Aquila chrysaetos chrysaetos TaxID=223781 RepID=UPI0011772C05|nr:translation initiation factor IF-2-like [Aquila chrysaetos chrysaetos]